MKAALERLRAAGVRVLEESPVFETQPVACGPQPPYLNQVILTAPDLSPFALLALCMGIEAGLGRLRNRPHAARTVDLDLLFFGDLILATPSLTLPHPAIPRRRSILVPLSKTTPNWRHPKMGKTVLEMLAECADTSWVVPFG